MEEKLTTFHDDGHWRGRAVLLMDLDAFFASVEQLDHPEWRGKPVIVGGDASKRGVVSTCSYEARRFGVRSAMPSSTAARLCPDAIWTPGRYGRYREVSAHVMEILTDESPFIQQVSIDEAFLDVTPDAYSPESPVIVAQRIQDRVCQLGVTCSIGLGVSKSVAKVASDIDKPRGLTVVYPGREASFLSSLPTKCMSGIGPVAQSRLKDFGITTLGQVAAAEASILHEVFGSNAATMRLRCLGADADPVRDDDGAKSISNEVSFAEDVTSGVDARAALVTVSAKVARRLRKAGLHAGGITLKVRYADMQVRTAARMLPLLSDDEFLFAAELGSLLAELWSEGMPLRLLGMAATHLDGGPDGPPVQDTLFGMGGPSDRALAQEGLRAELESATDRVRDRFGEHAVMFGSEMRTRANLTGSGAKNPEDYKQPRHG